MAYKIFFTFLITFIVSITNAQVVLVPLESNPVIEKYIKENTDNPKNLLSNDTISFPFFDDFSKYSVYPDQSNWLDNSVFVNQSYGDNPPSIGVATFDALNFAGQLHSNATSNGFISDTLTSKPINLLTHIITNPILISSTLLFYHTGNQIYYPADSLSYVSGGTVHNCMTEPVTYNINYFIYYGNLVVSDSLYTYDSSTSTYTHIDKTITYNINPSDSLYLSFYYQPQGIGGNAPEAADSLVLEFKVPGNSWKHIWSKPGSANHAFKQVLIPLTVSTYFIKGFQFRFKNYASIGTSTIPSFASNVDMWNIDYVKIGKNRNQFDTIPNDVAFVYNAGPFIKNFYSVPWAHYKSVTNQKKDTLKFFYRNLSDTLRNVQCRYKITNKTNNTVIFDRSLGNENDTAFTDYYFIRKDTANYFPFNSDNQANFEVRISQTFSTLDIHAPYRWNDTLKFYQKFESHYAYDDGTAEYGFGLAGNNTQNGKVAFKFYTLKPDTIRGVYMFFNRALNDANQKFFYLTIWSAANGRPSQIIYSQMGEKPQFHGLNEFHYYSLDTSIFITDTFFVGWIQTTQDLLNMGFDLNSDNSSKVFYNISGNWQNIPYAGTPMMRPVFSTMPFVNINESVINKEISIYPNPASDYININVSSAYNFQIFDITGRVVLQTKTENEQINVSTIPSGVYILRGSDGKSQFTRKLIINR
ncbi:MAG: T9SS type A sorting domain-containing protein [Bacteroidia bacterium]|nr:T9SS type A sorting domain-containing protein [Bacteroidia bacterium]